MPSVHLIVPELTDIEVAAGAGDASEGTVTSIGWFSDEADTPGNAAFIQSYTEAYGEEAGCLGSTIVCHAQYSRRGNCAGVCD